MNVKNIHPVATVALAVTALSAMASLPGHDKRDFTDEFSCPGGQYVTSGGVSEYFPLNVGSISYLDNSACVAEGECDEAEAVRITVTVDTELVDGVLTRVVELVHDGGRTDVDPAATGN